MKINIPFNRWSMERLYDGRKCATSRNKKYGVVGDWFEVVFKDRMKKAICNCGKELIFDKKVNEWACINCGYMYDEYE